MWHSAAPTTKIHKNTIRWSSVPQCSRRWGLRLISFHFLLCSLCALMCFPPQNVRAYSPTHLRVTARILCLRQFFSPFVILFHTWSFFFPPNSEFWKGFALLFLMGDEGRVCLKRLNLFWWRDIPPSASILPLTRQDVMLSWRLYQLHISCTCHFHFLDPNSPEQKNNPTELLPPARLSQIF